VLHRVERRDPLDVLPALAGRDARDHIGPVRAIPQRVERSLRTRDTGDHDLRVLIDEDRHRYATPSSASSAARSAASSIVAAGTILGWFASARVLPPSPALLA